MNDDNASTVSTDEHEESTDEHAVSTDEHEKSTDEHAQTGADPDTVTALDDHAVPLDTDDPMADFADLEPLRERFEEARIVGLGEATHGTREFFRLKHRILRYLVVELDVRAFGLEANFPETLALNEYVVHGEGDPREALAGIYLWPWQVKSVLDLVEWLRAFNAERPLEDRVRFYGLDATYTHGAVDELAGFFEGADPEFLATVESDLEAIDDEGMPAHLDEGRTDRVEAIERVAPRLRERLDEHRAAYVAETSERAWKLACRHVRVLEQVGEHRRASHDRGEGLVEEPAATERCLRVRDRAMADNAEWILAHEDADRMVLWAHDAHVNRSAQRFRDTEATAPSLGSNLADRYGDGYYALGFSFGRGSFQALTVATDEEVSSGHPKEAQILDGPLPDTIDRELAELGHEIAVLDVRGAREDGRLAEWLSEPRRHFSTGAVYDPGNPEAFVTEYAYSEAFDGVCYVDETTRARPLD